MIRVKIEHDGVEWRAEMDEPEAGVVATVRVWEDGELVEAGALWGEDGIVGGDGLVGMPDEAFDKLCLALAREENRLLLLASLQEQRMR